VKGGVQFIIGDINAVGSEFFENGAVSSNRDEEIKLFSCSDDLIDFGVQERLASTYSDGADVIFFPFMKKRSN